MKRKYPLTKIFSTEGDKISELESLLNELGLVRIEQPDSKWVAYELPEKLRVQLFLNQGEVAGAAGEKLVTYVRIRAIDHSYIDGKDMEHGFCTRAIMEFCGRTY